MLKTLYKLFLNSSGISTDTRVLKENQIYFALKGDNFDGNKYADQALEKGALCVVVDDASILINKQDKPYFLVSDVLITLQKLAKYHREVLDIPILGITGTNGKTTTKELCYSVLSLKFNVFATKGNLNNHIGVPLSLLSITNEHNFAIIEMGANHPGEIKTLCEIATPNYGVITNIGYAHLEGFGSLEGVIKTKRELFEFVSKQEGIFFYPKEDIHIPKFASNYKHANGYSYKDIQSFVFYMPIIGQIYSSFSVNGIQINSNLFGEYNVQNMACVYTIAHYLGLTKLEIKQGIEDYLPQNNRSQLLNTTNNKLIIDAYNANPTSLAFAIKSFLDLENSSKVLILGDMFELGEYAQNEHQNIINLLLQRISDFKQTYLVGINFNSTDLSNSDQILSFVDRSALEDYIKEYPLKNETILLKGSRGIGLEHVIELL